MRFTLKIAAKLGVAYALFPAPIVANKASNIDFAPKDCKASGISPSSASHSTSWCAAHRWPDWRRAYSNAFVTRHGRVEHSLAT